MTFHRKIIIFLLMMFVTGVAFSAKQKPLLLATEATYPPFEYMDSQGKMRGFDVDILKAVCQQMNTKCQFVNQAWDSLIPGLQLGKFDVIFGAMAITPERQRHIDFTIPYYDAGGVLVGSKKIQWISIDQSLQGKTIGVQTATTFDHYLHTLYGKTVHLNHYASIQNALLDLQSGRIDAAFGDQAVMTQWLKESGNKGYKILGNPINDPKFFGSGYGFAVKKGNTQLLNSLNKGIEIIKSDGTYQKIAKQYLAE